MALVTLRDKQTNKNYKYFILIFLSYLLMMTIQNFMLCIPGCV